MSESGTQTVETGRGLNVRLILGILALGALALFVFQNTDDVAVEFLTWDGTVPLYLLLLITVGLTLILSVVATWVLRRRR